MKPFCEHGLLITTCRVCRSQIPRAAPRAYLTESHGATVVKAQKATPVDGFIDALVAFLETERSVARRDYDAEIGQSVERRVEAGRAIRDVEVLQVVKGDARIEGIVVRFQENLSKFRQGGNAVLHQGDPKVGYPVTIKRENDHGYVLGESFRSSLPDLKPGTGWFLDEALDDYEQNTLKGLEDFRQSPRREYIHKLLTGGATPAYDPQRLDEARTVSHRMRLDDHQREAFVKAYATRNYHLIQGPPGSGKTEVLGLLAASLAARGEKVLVTAQTHRAINHALRKTQVLRFGTEVAKLGFDGQQDGDVDSYQGFWDWKKQWNGQGGVVVGATAHKSIPSAFFDTVVFDESSQLTLPLAIRGMLAGKRFVFIGDDQQMEPVVRAKHTPSWVARSVFRHLREFDPGTMLATTYRMNAEINAFPSQRFYAGQLQPAASARGRRLALRQRPARFADILDPNVPSVVVDVPHAGASVRSPEEAELAAALVVEAVRCGVPPSEICVITPYRAQERLIRNLLRDRARAAQFDPARVAVDTVERIQGQERDLAIVSLTVSDLAHASESAEFFFRPSRLNVALTRCRSKRIVLMEPNLLNARTNPTYRDWVENFRAFVEASPRMRTPLAAR